MTVIQVRTVVSSRGCIRGQEAPVRLRQPRTLSLLPGFLISLTGCGGFALWSSRGGWKDGVGEFGLRRVAFLCCVLSVCEGGGHGDEPAEAEREMGLEIGGGGRTSLGGGGGDFVS